jgi:ATP-binding cassette subfamily B protein
VREADQIAVVDAGRVVELGSHDELMALGGHYRDLVERQL